MKFLAALTLVFSLSALACTEDGSTGFLPENDLSIPVGFKSAGGLSEVQFNHVIDKVEKIYVPIAKAMGGNLKIARKWTDGTVNANATRLGGWNVNMYGGLARHETITEDGFALVLCHEIGHHLGGAPKVSGMLGLNRWASNEGQADYYATLKCLRRVFEKDNNANVVKKLKAPETLVNACAKAYPGKALKSDKDICIRNGMAGVSVAALFAALRSQPEATFDTPDTRVVSRTDDAHPAHQCRLDTYFQGAICTKAVNDEVSQKDEVPGTCHAASGDKSGLRPLCWFKPSK